MTVYFENVGYSNANFSRECKKGIDIRMALQASETILYVAKLGLFL